MPHVLIIYEWPIESFLDFMEMSYVFGPTESVYRRLPEL